MTAASTEPRVCSVARTLDVVGEKWALLAVREIFLGDRRFDEMVRRTGAPRDTLAARTSSPKRAWTSTRSSPRCARGATST
jgi:DNA-binding HxlR family transcriptional regulator